MIKYFILKIGQMCMCLAFRYTKLCLQNQTPYPDIVITVRSTTTIPNLELHRHFTWH